MKGMFAIRVSLGKIEIGDFQYISTMVLSHRTMIILKVRRFAQISYR